MVEIAEEEINLNFSIFTSIKYVFIKNNDNKKMIKIKKENLKVTDSSIKEFEEYKECKVLQNIKSIIGCIEIFGIKYIIYVCKCDLVATFASKQIYLITVIDFCLCDSTSIPSNLKNDLDFIFKGLKEVIENNFYFSYGYDLTNNIQLTYEKNVKKENSKFSSILSLNDKKSFVDYKYANSDYFFNKSMIEILNSEVSLNQWLPIIIYGNISSFVFDNIKLLLIRRRNCRNLNKFCGLQGISTNSQKLKTISNLIENELILLERKLINQNEEKSFIIKSFVYLSSSLPISFSINFKSSSMTINKEVDSMKNDIIDYYKSSQYRNNLLVNLTSNFNYNDQMLNQQMDYIMKQIDNIDFDSNKKEVNFNETFKYCYSGLINSSNINSDENEDKFINFENNPNDYFGKIKSKIGNFMNLDIELKEIISYFDHFEYNSEFEILTKIQLGYLNLSSVNYDDVFILFSYNLCDYVFQSLFKNLNKEDRVELIDKENIDFQEKFQNLLLSNFFKINFQFTCSYKNDILKCNKKEAQEYIQQMKIQTGLLKLMTREHIMSTSVDYLNKLNEIIFFNNHRYRDEQKIKAHVVSFNIGAAKEYNENDIFHLFSKYDFSDDKNSNLPELLILGFQEIVKLSAMNILVKSSANKVNQLKNCIEKIINVKNQYKEIHTSELVGLCLIVYCKQECYSKINNIDSQIIKLGLGGFLGNKGALVIRFDYCQTSIALMCCHLEAGPNKNNNRVKQIKEILNSSMFIANEEIERLKNEKSIKVDEIFKNDNFIKLRTFTMKNKKSILSNRSSIISLDECLDTKNFSLKLKDHDVVILFGDLNFRIDLKFDEAIKIIENQNFSELLRYDQYFKNGVINDMVEGEIKFPPSYKFKTEDEKDKDNFQSPYSRHKNRTPSWCDRILYKQNYLIKNQVEVIDYNYVPEIILSDHKPVYAIFNIRVFSENKEKRKSFEDICSNKLKYLIEDEEVVNSIVMDDNEVKMFYKILQNHNNTTSNINPRISKCIIDDNFSTVQNINQNKLLAKLQNDLISISNELNETDFKDEFKLRSYSTLK